MADLRLHLGCGGTYLEGYRNIDLPAAEQGVQEGIRPDEYADITRLDYAEGSVAEVRLHHVFEHFDRQTAIRLLIDWHRWLRPGGTLCIETPDFKRSARAFFLHPTAGARLKTLRHVFGSTEADWAVHKDGWYAQRFRLYLGELGYERLKFKRARWHGTYNITVTARRGQQTLSREELLSRAEGLLRRSLVDDAASEQAILEVWMADIRGAG